MTRLTFLGSWLAALPFFKKSKEDTRNKGTVVEVFRFDGDNAPFDIDLTERLHTQLAGCSCAAFGYAQDVVRGDYGWSVALDDVNTLYLEHIALKKRLIAIANKQGTTWVKKHSIISETLMFTDEDGTDFEIDTGVSFE